MNLFGNNKEKHGSQESNIMDNAVNIEINEENKKEPGEEKSEMTEQKRKKYMYIALDKDNNVILNRKGAPFFKSAEEGKLPEWPNSIYKIVQQVTISIDLRVEIEENSEKRKNATVIRRDAENKLKKLAADKIKQAQEKANLDRQANQPVNTDPVMTAEEVHDSGVELNVESLEAISTIITGALKDKIPSMIKDVLNNEKREYIITPLEEISGDIVETVGRDIREEREFIERKISELKSTYKGSAKDISENAIRDIKRNTENTIQDIKKNTEDIMKRNNRDLKEEQEKNISKVNNICKHIEEWSESIELMESHIHKLSRLDEIMEVLCDKNLIMSTEIPPVKTDEEDIVNLVRYSQKITEQLGYAARELVRKQEVFKNQEQNNANEQKAIEQKLLKSHKDGIREGKLYVIRQLIDKYEGIDAVKDSDNQYVHVIWTMLRELGVDIDGNGQFEKGQILELSEDDINKMIAVYSKLDGAGRYKVLKTGLVFDEEIICKTEFEKVKEEGGLKEADNEAGKENETDK